MRTTLDLPDPLFRQLKAKAALEGLTLKDLIATYVRRGLEQKAASEQPAETPFVSAYDVMRGGCGIVDSGTFDLASNPRHMEGFGDDAFRGRGRRSAHRVPRRP